MHSLCSTGAIEVDTETPEELKARARLAAKLAALGEAPKDDAAAAERRRSHAAASTSAGGHSGTDGTVTSLTVEAVRQTIAELYRRVPTGMCANCHAHAPVIKRCASAPWELPIMFFTFLHPLHAWWSACPGIMKRGMFTFAPVLHAKQALSGQRGLASCDAFAERAGVLVSQGRLRQDLPAAAGRKEGREEPAARHRHCLRAHDRARHRGEAAI
jgi:hypothetical protein